VIRRLSIVAAVIVATVAASVLPAGANPPQPGYPIPLSYGFGGATPSCCAFNDLATFAWIGLRSAYDPRTNTFAAGDQTVSSDSANTSVRVVSTGSVPYRTNRDSGWQKSMAIIQLGYVGNPGALLVEFVVCRKDPSTGARVALVVDATADQVWNWGPYYDDGRYLCPWLG